MRKLLMRKLRGWAKVLFPKFNQEQRRDEERKEAIRNLGADASVTLPDQGG